MTTAAIIQARFGSTRFPRKVAADLGGAQLLLHVLRRVRAVPGVDAVVLALPKGEFNLWLGAKINRVVDRGLAHAVIFGPDEDVLARYHQVAAIVKADVIVRVTGDCPFWPSDIGASMLDTFVRDRYEYLTNDTTRTGFPDGADVQIFTRELLERADRHATDQRDREHVCPWIARHVEAERFGTQMWGGTWAGDLKVSVDTPADLARVRAIYPHVPTHDVTLPAVLAAAQAAGVWTPDRSQRAS